MKSILLFLGILVFASQAFAWETYKTYDPFQAGRSGNLAVPYAPVLPNRPLGYQHQPYSPPVYPELERVRRRSETENLIRGLTLHDEIRANQANACSFINGNALARKLCYSEIK